MIHHLKSLIYRKQIAKLKGGQPRHGPCLNILNNENQTYQDLLMLFYHRYYSICIAIEFVQLVYP